jgi:monofunctional glycosyltransferase
MTKYFLLLKKILSFLVPMAILGVGIKIFICPYYEVQALKTKYPVVAYPDRLDSSRYIFQRQKPGHWVSLKTISPRLIPAILVSEDANFFNHSGVDWAEIHNAMADHFLKGKRWRGASTLTQQLAKNLFLGPQRSVWRKSQELIYTYYLEQQLSKSQILEIYLNSVEFGDKIFGISQASDLYFNKMAKNLLIKEAAFLAMLLPNPKKNSQSFYKKHLTPYAQRIITQILYKMSMQRYLGFNEVQAALTTPFPWEMESMVLEGDHDYLYN